MRGDTLPVGRGLSALKRGGAREKKDISLELVSCRGEAGLPSSWPDSSIKECV